ncbi:MAG TPA: hypothetical protein VJZ27_13250 [Aggregatilineales bacterium]|nr:hypothetical protein [Aggregatilineales bacterium]
MKQPDRRYNRSYISSAKRGIMALLKRNLPAALTAFIDVYRSPKWQERDLAVTGLGDMLDSRLAEQHRHPAVIVAVGWVPASVPKHRQLLSDERWLALLDSYPHPSQWSPRNLNEQKALHALRRAQAMLEHILISDASHLVRFGALLMLTEKLNEAHHHTIISVLERAYRYEKDKTLRFMIGSFIASETP